MYSLRKRLLSLIMVLSICLCVSSVCNANQATTQGVTAAASGLIGDLNGDGAIDALDYSLMKQFLLGTVTDLPVQDDLYAADLDGDAKITALDLALSKQYLLGLITKFPKIPPQNITTVIMPLGDSITDGITVPGAYRIKLWNNITSAGQKVDFVGSMSNGPTELGDKNHEGHSGWRIDQIDANINAWMTTYKPKIVLLHIGTNDISQKYDLNNAPNRLSSLIDKICAKLPSDGKLYVAKVIPLSYADVRNYNTQVAQVVQNKANQGKPVFVVDMYSAVTTADLPDGVHCSRTGYDKMADVWYNAIKNDLGK
ncbi:GDSL-type esterase/lipase family protein [Ruminiclostridium cellulolyticum]|uniref:cellulase n=1 Tax=Ruminiclostridium cellulolyticum (strain ATCC 35319 / DSM 5812 / JCM 6584 / H10) TaxID=394503 RepID=B8I5J2_RUMCH|nr:GDSL-type esterase/lipase family protein [Ruminiclostridium cellulolyticum]ACL76728.1 lipolytic protein G-D-S-L family [Ruminiclostridium cellulolyticum H10]